MGLNPVGLRNGCTVGAATKNTGRLKKFGVIFPRCRKKTGFYIPFRCGAVLLRITESRPNSV